MFVFMIPPCVVRPYKKNVIFLSFKPSLYCLEGKSFCCCKQEDFTCFGYTSKRPYFRDMEKTIYSDDYAKLRQWLRERRNEKNLTMRELAERMDVIHSWIGKIELGERRLDIIEYIQYCKALEVDPIEGIKLIA